MCSVVLMLSFYFIIVANWTYAQAVRKSVSAAAPLTEMAKKPHISRSKPLMRMLICVLQLLPSISKKRN